MMNMHQFRRRKIYETLFWIMAVFAGIGIGAVTHAFITWLVPIV